MSSERREPRPAWAVAAQSRHLAAAQRITHCGSWELDLGDLDDIDANPLRWSDEVFRIFGYEPGAIAVTNDNFFAAVHPDDRDAIREAVRTALATGTNYSIDHRVIRPDGSVRFVREASEVQYDAAGKPLLMIGTIVDITEQKHAEDALRRAQEAAVVADRLASIGIVAAGVAHEINNPLAVIGAGLELVARAGRDVDLGADVRQALADAQLAMQRVRVIVGDLRVFARDEREARVAVDVNAVLDATLRMAARQIDARARLVTSLAPVPPVIASDARLGQVFLNLLVNAVQAIPDGDPHHHELRVRTAARGDAVVIAIADTGIGIRPEHRARLFTPFFTTKDVGVGSGLGLSICHGIVTGFGGAIEVDSEPGRGTEFRVVLPAAPPGTQVAPRASELDGAASAPARRRGQVLIVDDEPMVGNALAALIDDHHDVVTMTSAANALTAIRDGARFDAIVCDLMMPEMTGMQLHAALAAIAPEQAARLVAMTGGAYSTQAREFLATSGRPSVDKPFDVAQLLDAIDRVMR